MLTIVIVSALGTLAAYLLWRYAEARLTNTAMRSAATSEHLENLRLGARIAGVYLFLPLFLITLLAEAGPLTVQSPVIDSWGNIADMASPEPGAWLFVYPRRDIESQVTSRIFVRRVRWDE